jgi:guanine deaminase
MVACRDLARDHGIGLHSHIGEAKFQAVSGLKRYGKTLTAHIDDLGLLGQDFTAAHGVWLDDDDMKRLADNGASVSHNPGSNALLGSGIADARRMLEFGINLGIGTDGANCADHQNMYEAMRMASLMSHVRGPDRQQWLEPAEILLAATEGSARALGFEKIGRIEPGFKADIVFLDTRSINWIPINNPVNQIVHTEDGSSVHSVMVGGEMVIENRKHTRIDIAKLAADAERARERLTVMNAETRNLCNRLELVSGSFCPALARKPYHVNRYAAFS